MVWGLGFRGGTPIRALSGFPALSHTIWFHQNDETESQFTEFQSKVVNI
jgi:hypothetical protein